MHKLQPAHGLIRRLPTDTEHRVNVNEQKINVSYEHADLNSKMFVLEVW